MLGSYYNMPIDFYRPPPAGTPGWQEAPVPGWGINPLRAGPRRVGVGADEPVTIDVWRPGLDRYMGGGIPEQNRVLPHYAALAGGGIPEQDRVLPRYTAVGGCGCGPQLAGAEEDAYKQTTWGHVALAAAGGILTGMLFMYLYKAAKG